MNTDIFNTRRDWKDVLGREVPQLTCPRRHYKLSPLSSSLVIEMTGQPYVDRSAMSARAVISSATVDRVGDLLLPAGCQLTNYAKNPVVLWAHGLEGIGRPIATSRDPDGNLAVTISECDVQATSWFSQSSLEAAQIFELIDEGIVRATSVRETPIKSRVRRDPEAGDILIVEEWDLEEWSWCAVGVNPDAVAKTLHRNRLGGQPIAPLIIKSLTAVAPTQRRFGVGIPTEKNMTDCNQTNDDAINMSDDESPLSWDGDDVDTGTKPYGATVVSAVYTSLVSACQSIEDAMGPLENPAVKEGLQAILTALQDQLTAVEGLFSASYPEQPELKSEEDDGDDDGETMKAFLASGRVATLQVLGLGSRLKGLIGARNITPSQRQTLTGVAKQLAKLVAQSKLHQCENDEAKIAALQNSISELTGLVGGIKK